jgi:hypothetical protein
MSEDTPNELALKRAEKAKDCRLCSTEDVLLDMVREVREMEAKGRKTRLVAMWLDYDPAEPEGPSDWHTRFANVTKSQSATYFRTAALSIELEMLGR